MAKEPDRRFDAAQAVFKSRDPSALPNIDKALEKETEPRVKKALTEARAAIVLYSADSTPGRQDRRDCRDPRPRRPGRARSPRRPAVGSAACRPPGSSVASAKIQGNLALWNAIQNAWYGLSLGSVLLLAAIGLAITFGVMGVINMAHGEMVMLGAYTTFVVQEFIRHDNPALFDYSLAIAVPLAFVVSGAVGIAIERSIIRFLYGRPLETLLATWGLSLILQQAIRTHLSDRPTRRSATLPG